MTDGEAILAAIIADPDDDMPRLAYADWLEEQGRDAHTIRHQIVWPDSCWHHPNGVGIVTNDRTGEYIVPNGAAFIYRRGFLDEVHCDSLVQWKQIGPALIVEHPITVVRATDRSKIRRPMAAQLQDGPLALLWEIEGESPEGAYEIAPEVYALLTGFISEAEAGTWKAWETEKAAYEALSRALIQLAFDPTAATVR